jgi:flagellar basal-body rod protein FlgB
MDSILGIHEAALSFRAKRMEVLATNLANADTPHFKARDLEFGAVLAGAGRAARLAVTNPRHMEPRGTLSNASLQYRMPHQPAADGNTVESDQELARFADNAVAYQTSLLFINGRISTLRAALTGSRS